MPVWLLWLLPVLLATLLAIAWTAFASRTRGPVEAIDSVQAYERFRRRSPRPCPRPAPGRAAGPVRRARSTRADLTLPPHLRV